jgi:hypothetical protein
MHHELLAEIRVAVREAIAHAAPNDKLAYSVRNFAKAADMGCTSVYAEIKSGKLKARRIGDRLIIPASEAHAYLASLPEAA